MRFIPPVLKLNNQIAIMPMNASGAPFGGGGSLHDIMRRISAETKETKKVMSGLTADIAKLSDDSAHIKAALEAQNREMKAQIALAKSTLAEFGPALLLRGGQGRRDQAAQSSLGKRPREAAAAATTDGPAVKETASLGRYHNECDCLNAYRRERDQLAANLEVDAAARTTTTTTASSTSSTITNGNSVQQMRDVAAVYLFGLEKVGALQDLRQAPDAILPGNFVEQPVTAAAVAVANTTNVEMATVATAPTESATTLTATKAKTPVDVAVAASTETKTTVVADEVKK